MVNIELLRKSRLQAYSAGSSVFSPNNEFTIKHEEDLLRFGVEITNKKIVIVTTPCQLILFLLLVLEMVLICLCGLVQ